MKNLKKISMLLILSAFSVSILFAQGQTEKKENKKSHSEMKAERLEKMQEELNLSDEQKAEIQSIKEKHEVEKKELRAKLQEINRVERAEIRTVLTEEQIALMKENRQNRREKYQHLKHRDGVPMERRQEMRQQNLEKR